VPATPELAEPDAAARMAPALWRAVEAKAGRKPTEYSGIPVVSMELLGWVLRGKVAV
jgi:hypothetical protein